MPTIAQGGDMKKQEWEQALKVELRKVSNSERRKWDGNRLFGWFLELRNENSRIRWEGCPGDDWQQAHAILARMIGKDARD